MPQNKLVVSWLLVICKNRRLTNQSPTCLERSREITNHQKGFTLIELLVSISIITIVFGIVITAAQAVQKQSRDSQRKTDLRSLQSALQQYYADQNFYPQDSSGTPALSLTPGTAINNCSGNPNTCTVGGTYLNKIPQDPTNASTFVYSYKAFAAGGAVCSNVTDNANRCINFCLYAQLETAPNPALGNCNGATSPPGANFWVSQP